MDLNIYKNKHSKEFDGIIELNKVFSLIKTKASDLPKADRLGVVYASKSKKGRKHEDIVSYNGMVFIDVDECKEPKKIKELFTEIDCTIATWYSTSGNVHALIKIPVCNSKNEFKRRYELLVKDLKDEIEDWGVIDEITSNPTQLAFISNDADIYINDAPETYEGIYLPSLPKKNRKIKFNVNNDTSTKWCVGKVEKWYNDIVDNGYPQVLKYAMTLGGWSAAGYIENNNALEVLLALIKHNNYLNSNQSSGSLETYLKAATSSFNEGLKHPLHWH